MIEGAGAADDNTAFQALDIVSHRVEALGETLVELIAETTTIADNNLLMNRRMIEENGSAQMNVEILKGQCEQSLTLQLLQGLHSGRHICHTDPAKQG
jgi:hypothetical protein